MKITSEIISINIDLLEKAKKDFLVLEEFSKNPTPVGRTEAISYGLLSYVIFIEFIHKTLDNNQQVFYKKKIKNKEFQDILVSCATDLDAKTAAKSKGPKTFGSLINSKRWELFCAMGSSYRRRKKRYINNFEKSEAIIANFCIQNEIEISDTSVLNRVYTYRLPDIDLTVKGEIDKTKEIIDFIVNKISESGSDFRRLNYDHLTNIINTELKSRILTIDPGERIKCIELATDTYGIEVGKVYDVLEKELTSGRLSVYIINDYGHRKRYNYRLFETLTNLRNSALDDLLSDL